MSPTRVRLAAVTAAVSLTAALTACGPATDGAPGASVSQPAAAGPIPLVRPGCAGLAIGHRGAPREAPEDTLPSERRSQRLGSDYLELDLHLTKDGVPVVMHDDTVDRTTDGTGPVSDLSLAQVERLDAGSWFSRSYAGTRVPTFARIVRFAQRTGVRIMPELKAGWTRAQVKIVVDLIEKAHLVSHTVLQSFDPQALAYAADLAPQIARAGLVTRLPADPVAYVRSFHGQALLPAYALVDARLVRRLHTAGIAVIPWVADTTTAWDRLRADGVDGIMSNETADLVAWTRAHRC
ncbi:glycerophosphodiester phosphodiesterase [Nocardioides sp. DS6]|uniref:Glycerophosphodiester phosphodiesterase n=1 Tax=Nocardioides eburneus TaxID=3231482 RepID=A0ABV3SXD5_9ACTN